MAQADFVHDGEAIDYTPGSDVAAGQVVVQGDLVGVAKRDIPANKPGALSVEGVFDVAKQPGLPFAAGDLVFWDAANLYAVATSTGNKLLGKAVRAALDSAATVRARLTPCAIPIPEPSSSA